MFLNEYMIMNTTGGENVDEDGKCSVYRARTLVRFDRANAPLSEDCFQMHTDTRPDYSSAYAHTRAHQTPLNVKNATGSDETPIRRVVCLLDYSAHLGND